MFKLWKREPIYSVGDKVIDKKGNIGTIYSVYSYCFDKDEYFYSVEEKKDLKVKAETNLNLYEKKISLRNGTVRTGGNIK